MTEQELIQEIMEAQLAMNLARIAMADFKRKCMDAESLLIEFKIKKERLEEELKMLKARQVVDGQEYYVFDDE